MPSALVPALALALVLAPPTATAAVEAEACAASSTACPSFSLLQVATSGGQIAATEAPPSSPRDDAGSVSLAQESATSTRRICTLTTYRDPECTEPKTTSVFPGKYIIDFQGGACQNIKLNRSSTAYFHQQQSMQVLCGIPGSNLIEFHTFYDPGTGCTGDREVASMSAQDAFWLANGHCVKVTSILRPPSGLSGGHVAREVSQGEGPGYFKIDGGGFNLPRCIAD